MRGTILIRAGEESVLLEIALCTASIGEGQHMWIIGKHIVHTRRHLYLPEVPLRAASTYSKPILVPPAV